MNVVVITSSHHRAGTSALLADRFCAGAAEAGHSVRRFDMAFEKVGFCLACDVCGCGERPCVQHDAMEALYPAVEAADLIAFVTPIYYYSYSGRLKCVIDRFYAIDSILEGSDKSGVLLATCADTTSESLVNCSASYESLLSYMGWKDAGQVLASGCSKRSDAENSEYPQAAYELGASI
ncbi:MAG: flavodoxin family protein [Atopobiaceae bacterium]|nr:flavodoxin family protein [Atopobiaceae bacterium]MCI2172868.1 flavodoxin family protein [Atopobiaceae bacterium]MCI2207175.1 flavodoxin family protein [Atopobiaceae bacterium]